MADAPAADIGTRSALWCATEHHRGLSSIGTADEALGQRQRPVTREGETLVYLDGDHGEDRNTGQLKAGEGPSSCDGATENRLLALLPRAVRARLVRHFEPIHLARKDLLFRTHEPVSKVYFPDTAVVALISTLESGESLEVGLIGRDGFTPPAVFPGITMMPCDGVVLVPGLACRIDAEVLRYEILADDVLHSTLGRFVQLLLVRSMQRSVCNIFHSVEQRCIRWLLTISDLTDDGVIPVTHDRMAAMLGVHRPTVTLVLHSLYKAGLVDETRGRLAIRDRVRLERACCECYRIVRDEQRRLLGY
jgi:CRP-like cAMP-binding protein